MTLDELEGRRFAIDLMQDAFKSPSAWTGAPLESALNNLERIAKGKPAGYARGILSFVAEARKLVGARK